MYDVYFDKVLLPVAPAKIKTSIKNKNKTIELINEGEVNMPKEAGLTELSFGILLPNQQYHFAKYVDGFKDASYYLNVLKEYKTKKQPFQLIVSRVLPGGRVLFYTNMKVSLEDYSIEDDAKEGFDTKVTVSLKQYRDYGTKTTDISSSAPKVATPKRNDGEGAKTTGTSYTIASGDTLWNVAKKKMGDGSKWKELYTANKSVIEKAAKAHGKASSGNGQWIYAGTKITIV